MQKEVLCLLSAWATLIRHEAHQKSPGETPTMHAHTEVLGSVFSHRKAQAANVRCQRHCFCTCWLQCGPYLSPG